MVNISQSVSQCLLIVCPLLTSSDNLARCQANGVLADQSHDGPYRKSLSPVCLFPLLRARQGTAGEGRQSCSLCVAHPVSSPFTFSFGSPPLTRYPGLNSAPRETVKYGTLRRDMVMTTYVCRHNKQLGCAQRREHKKLGACPGTVSSRCLCKCLSVHILTTEQRFDGLVIILSVDSSTAFAVTTTTIVQLIEQTQIPTSSPPAYRGRRGHTITFYGPLGARLFKLWGQVAAMSRRPASDMLRTPEQTAPSVRVR